MSSQPNPLPTQIPVAVHGPYEDLAIAAIELIRDLYASQPPEIKNKMWNDTIQLIDNLHNLASKLDFFHVFVGQDK